eukprot:298428-Amorphochlora_amoeboformis.AAC.1
MANSLETLYPNSNPNPYPNPNPNPNPNPDTKSDNTKNVYPNPNHNPYQITIDEKFVCPVLTKITAPTPPPSPAP